MPTIGEYHARQAKEFVANQQAAVNILQRRIKWHQEQLEQTDNQDERRWHEDYILRDQDGIEDVKHRHERRAEFYQRQGTTLELIKFEE